MKVISRGIKYLCNKWAKFRLRKYLGFIKSRPIQAIPADYCDLWFLYKMARRRKPKVILEFGSGCSTCILAQALKDNGEGYLYSLESDSYWQMATIKSMPAHLSRLYEVRYAPLLEMEYEGVPVFKHTNIPDIIPDFLYLDGPWLRPDRQVVKEPLDMEDRLEKGFIMIVDGREENVRFLKTHLKRKYKFKRRHIFYNFTFELLQ